MATGMLPADGELRLGPVALPAGRQIASILSGDPVAWATIQDVPDAGRVWAALCDARQQTGLVPFLLAGLDATTTRPWDSGEFEPPADTAELDHIDAADVLKERWDGEMYEVDDPGEAEDPEFVAYIEAAIAPFSRQFPGLAPASGQQLDPGHLGDVLGSLPAARVGLVSATRPADVLPLIGRTASDQFADALPVAADRAGFQHLVAEVSLGRAGIVLGLECSRLARDSADWQQLVKICAHADTLILDEDGLYDPAIFNDRVLLGLSAPA